MTIKREVSIEDFEFWDGAADNILKLTYDERAQLETILDTMSCEELLSETDLNDLIWFDFEQVCEWLGLDYDEVMERDD